MKSWESCCGYDAFATDVFVFLQKLLARPTSLSQNEFKWFLGQKLLGMSVGVGASLRNYILCVRIEFMRIFFCQLVLFPVLLWYGVEKNILLCREVLVSKAYQFKEKPRERGDHWQKICQNLNVTEQFGNKLTTRSVRKI